MIEILLTIGTPLILAVFIVIKEHNEKDKKMELLIKSTILGEKE